MEEITTRGQPIPSSSNRSILISTKLPAKTTSGFSTRLAGPLLTHGPMASYPPGSAKHPVTGVTWDDAEAYARSVGKRLPLEEEWEFAARGPSGLLYPWGNTWRAGCANAGNKGKGLAPVGSYDCDSPFGVQDLIGNAWEWTASDWRPYPGGSLSKPTIGGEKVIRGGSWESTSEYASDHLSIWLQRSWSKNRFSLCHGYAVVILKHSFYSTQKEGPDNGPGT